MLNKNLIPPTINVEESCIEKDSILNLAVKLERKQLNCIGVSSLGIGGTNAHVIIEKYKEGDKTLIMGKEVAFNKEFCYIEPINCEMQQADVDDIASKSDGFDEMINTIITIFKDVTGSDVVKETKFMEFDSMDLVIILDKINSQLNANITINKITECKTIESLAKHIVKEKEETSLIIHKFNESSNDDKEYFFYSPRRWKRVVL